MSPWSPIELTRDCTATTVPRGEQVALTAGGLVEIVQRLGGSITVRTEMGSLLRLDGADADVLGLEVVNDVSAGTATGGFELTRVTDALQGIYDPEIPVSIVELGLVYRTEEVMLDDGRRRIEIDMTMTAPGCGMGDVLTADAKRAAEAVPGVDEAEVQMVFSPPWGAHMMSDAVKLQLGLL